MFHPSFNSDHVIVDLVDVFVQPVHHLGLQLGLSAEVLRFKLGGLDNAKDSIELFVLVVQVLTLLEQQLLVCLTLGVLVFAIVFISFSVNTCFKCLVLFLSISFLVIIFFELWLCCRHSKMRDFQRQVRSPCYLPIETQDLPSVKALNIQLVSPSAF